MIISVAIKTAGPQLTKAANQRGMSRGSVEFLKRSALPTLSR